MYASRSVSAADLIASRLWKAAVALLGTLVRALGVDEHNIVGLQDADGRLIPVDPASLVDVGRYLAGNASWITIHPKM